MKVSMSLETKHHKSNGYVVFIPNLTPFSSIEFEEFSLVFDYKENSYDIEVKSDNLNTEELSKILLTFYSYIKLLLGFYPKIINLSFLDKEEIAENYKTKEYYFRSDSQYIKIINKNKFKESFKKFQNLYNTSNIQFNAFDMATMECNHYADVSIVNILQSLDGLFDNLTKFNNKELITKNELSKFRRNIEYPNIDELFDNSSLYKDKTSLVKNNCKELFEKNLNNSTIRLNKLDFSDKLDLVFNNQVIDWFEHEKILDENNRYNYINLVKLFKNTRNRLSHCSSEIKDYLNGVECIAYIHKLIPIIRLCIIEEIDLDEYVNLEKLNNDLKEIDRYITDILKEE